MKKILMALVAALMLAPLASAAHSVTLTSGEVTPGDYTLKVDVEKFTLVDFAGKDAKKGEGHIHYLINGLPCNPDALPAKDADKCGDFYATTTTSFRFTNLEVGDVIGAELVLSDHTPSGTDSSGNLNGARVLSESTVVEDKGAPGFGIIAALAGLAAVAVLVRRK